MTPVQVRIQQSNVESVALNLLTHIIAHKNVLVKMIVLFILWYSVVLYAGDHCGQLDKLPLYIYSCQHVNR